MIPGKIFSKNGIAQDGKYTYVVNNSTSYNEILNSRTNPITINSFQTSKFISSDRVKLNQNQDKVETNELLLPSRYLIYLDHPFVSMTARADEALIRKLNPDYNINSFKWDDPVTQGEMIELTLNGDQYWEHITDYFHNVNFLRNKQIGNTNNPDFGNVLFSTHSKGSDKTYMINCGATGNLLSSYPTSVNLHATFVSGVGRVIYVVYVANVILDVDGVGFGVMQRRSQFPNTSRSFFLQDPYKDPKHEDMTFTYSVPMVRRFLYQHPRFKDIDNGMAMIPTANYGRKLIGGVSGNVTWNSRCIPNYTVSSFEGSGTKLSLPSNNRCLTASHFDTSSNRIVIVSTYESPDENSWPDSYRLYVSYLETGPTMAFAPSPSNVYIHIQDEIAKKNKSTYGRHMNIHQLDVTKWKEHYIISVSYDYNGEHDKLHTVMFKISVTAALTRSNINYMTHFRDRGYGAVMGLKNGEPE